MRTIPAAAGVMAAMLTLACSNASSVGPDRVVRVRMVPDSVSLTAGDTVRVEAFPLDADTAFLHKVPVAWSTESGTVAVVDGEGLITGVGSGTTHVSATAQGVVGQVIVVVP